MAEQLPEARGLSDAARVTERNYSDLLEKIKKFKEDNPSDVE
jgi:hypothetical protein